MKALAWLLISILVLSQSCIVQYPPYANSEDVMALEIGMPIDSVNATMKMEPNDIVSRDSFNTVYLYKYRTKEIKTVTPGLKRNKGLRVEGIFKECLVSVDTANLVYLIETRDEQVGSIAKKEKINFAEILNTVTTFLSVTIPAILVYITVDRNP